MDLEEELNELEKSFDETEKEFKKVSSAPSDKDLNGKQEKAEKLIKEIRGQLEFLRDQVDRSEDF